MKNNEFNNQFDINFNNACAKLRNNDLENAYKEIINILSQNPNAAEPHNLLGLLYEMNGDEQKARKHYRVSYVLDPTYKPACNNLERVSTIFLSKQIPYDFGDTTDEEKQDEKRDSNDLR